MTWSGCHGVFEPCFWPWNRVDCAKVEKRDINIRAWYSKLYSSWVCPGEITDIELGNRTTLLQIGHELFQVLAQCVKISLVLFMCESNKCKMASTQCMQNLRWERYWGKIMPWKMGKGTGREIRTRLMSWGQSWNLVLLSCKERHISEVAPNYSSFQTGKLYDATFSYSKRVHFVHINHVAPDSYW